MNIYSGFFDLEGEVRSIWELWTSNLQECKGYFILFLKPSEGGGSNLWSLQKTKTKPKPKINKIGGIVWGCHIARPSLDNPPSKGPM